MDELELKSDYCVRFQERNSEKDYIRLISDDGLAIMNINSCCILHNYLCDQCHCCKAHDNNNNTIRTTVTVRTILLYKCDIEVIMCACVCTSMLSSNHMQLLVFSWYDWRGTGGLH